MDEADDILTRPLGGPAPAAAPRPLLARLRGRWLGSAAALALVLAGTGLAVFGDPEGGQPRAFAPIAMRAAPTPAAPVPVAEAPREPGRRTAEEVERDSGVTVTRAGGAKAPEVAVIIGVPNAEVARMAPAPDPRLIERHRHGGLPRIGEGRMRPLDVYARSPDPAAGGARIAILVSGVGIGDSATAAAITRLPSAITLGISPYAQEADKTAARARLAGHEILLQLPMEPFDYPDSDPGPRTLLSSARPGENLDRLYWAMSRMAGYVGVVNFMGGKLAGEPGAFEPLLKEITGRGLGYFEDGTLPRSQAGVLSAKIKLPFARAGTVLDAVARPEAVDAALRDLEARALQGGLALASASASPMSIDRIARWARDLEARGISLVPVSTALRAPANAKVSKAD